MKDLPRVSAVILNWNGRNHLKQFLPSVCLSTYPNLQIVVGDNGSTDDSVAFIAANYPQVTVISNDTNYGFAGGYNKILNQVDAEYFILLNSDVEVHPQWIQPVIDLMESDTLIAAAQPKILSHKDKSKFEYAGAAGGLIDMFAYPFCKGRLFDSIESDKGQYDYPEEIFWASGAALFVKKALWVEIGGLDEDFFAHMEEIDLCWRLKNKGYKVMYCPGSKVYHVGGGTLNSENPLKTYLNFRNNLILIQKNLPFAHSSLIIFCRLWLDLMSWFKFIYDGKSKDAIAINRAHASFFRNFFKTARKAREIGTSAFNNTGKINKSIVWSYFVLKRKTFRDL